VQYLNAGSGILVLPGNPLNIQTLEDLCGHNVGVIQGAFQQQLANSIQCSGTAVNIIPFAVDDLNAVLADLPGHGMDAVILTFPPAKQTAENSNGALQLVPQQFSVQPVGMGVRKTSPELKSALATALSQVQASGEYASLLQKWGLQENSL